MSDLQIPSIMFQLNGLYPTTSVWLRESNSESVHFIISKIAMFVRLTLLYLAVLAIEKQIILLHFIFEGSSIMGLFLQILDQYKESRDTRESEGAATTGRIPKSVILIGHSMGGFVARAATIHPRLRKSAVETILTLSSPHQ